MCIRDSYQGLVELGFVDTPYNAALPTSGS